MGEMRELSPGVFLEGDSLFLCPACGLRRWGADPMDRMDVMLWLEATLTVLEMKGVRGADPSMAGALADAWIGGGHRTHKTGGCRGEDN